MTEDDREADGQSESAARGGLTGIVVRGVVVAGSGYVLTQILTLATYLILARLLSPSEFGVFAAGAIVINVGILFAESGMVAAVVQRRDRLDEAAATAVISSFASGFGFALLALGLAPLIGLFFDNAKIGEVATMMSGVLILRTLPIVPTALLQRRFSFLRRMVVEPVGVLAFGVTSIVATAGGMGVWALVLGTYANAVADLVLSWGLARWRPNLRLASMSMWRELIGYGRHVFVATALERGNGLIPEIVIARLLGPASLGQYRYATRIAATPYAVTLAAGSYVIFPALARIAEDLPRFREATVRSLRWIVSLVTPFGLLLIPLGEPIAVLVFGEIWREAGQIAAGLALLPVAGAAFSVACEVYTANGRPRMLMRMTLAHLVATAGAIAALSAFGSVGIAAGVSLGMSVAAIYSTWILHQDLNIDVRTFVAELVPPMLAGAAMVAVMLPVELLVIDAASRATGIGLALLAVEGICCLIVYAGALHVLAPGRLQELIGLLRGAAESRKGSKAVEPDDIDMLNDASMGR